LPTGTKATYNKNKKHPKKFLYAKETKVVRSLFVKRLPTGTKATQDKNKKQKRVFVRKRNLGGALSIRQWS
jgi:hypothetical protein